MTWTTITTIVQDQVVDIDIMNDEWAGNIQHVYDSAPKRATMWHSESLVLNGNAIASAVSTSQLHNAYSYQNTGADGDIFTNGCFLAAGTYTLKLLGVTLSAYGKLDWTIKHADAVSWTTLATGQDWYSAGGTYNVVKTISSIVLADPGWYAIKGTVNGKNGSSSGYQISLTNMTMYQAAD